MIETIIDYLNTQLSGTGLFTKNFCLCDIIYAGDGNSRPAHYLNNGSFEEINNFSSYSGMSYWRKSGKVRISEIEESKYANACNLIMDFTFPLRLVSVVPKSKANKDNEYTDDEIALKIFGVVNDYPKTLKQSLNAISVSVSVTDYETDNSSILKAEYSDPKITDLDYKFSYLAMEVVVNVKIKQSCIINPCS